MAKIKKVAWKASAASSGLARARRQTPRTIGPCRVTKAEKAASAPEPPPRNRSINWPSDRAATVPSSKRARNWRTVDDPGPFTILSTSVGPSVPLPDHARRGADRSLDSPEIAERGPTEGPASAPTALDCNRQPPARPAEDGARQEDCKVLAGRFL